MGNIPLEHIKSPPWDFVLVTSIQKQEGKNNYIAVGACLSKNPSTGQVDKRHYFYKLGHATFKLPKDAVYVPLDGIKQCAKLFNDGEIWRAKREEEKAEKLYSTPVTEDRFNYYKEVYVYLETWYHENGLVPPKIKPEVVYSILTTHTDENGEESFEFLYDEKGLDLIETVAEQASAPSDLSTQQIHSHEMAARDRVIKRQKDTIKALKVRQERPSPDELKALIDGHRKGKGEGKVNYTKLGETLGRDPDTIKSWIKKERLLGYALNE